MARKSKYHEEPEPKVDLTPMIDIVFNLIIFFLIVSELSNLAVEEIELAYADQAAATREEGRVLQLNVMGDNAVRVRGLEYAVGASGEGPPLAGALELEAAGYGFEDSPSGPVSALRLNIRADKEGPFERVQRVLDASMKARIHLTSFGASKETP